MKRLDLTGNRYGKLEALKRLESGKWECRCDCGNVKAIALYHLRSGATTHCGCSKRRSSLFKDETGKTYGRLTVLKQVEHERSGANWLCQCECGKQTVVWGAHLRNGNTTSCGCLARDRSRQAINKMAVGQRYGMLTCIKQVASKPPQWLFRCDCGDEKVINHHQVRYGGVKSCGCLAHKSQAEDLTGQRFGLLTVESFSDEVWVHQKTGKRRVMWNCSCDCGSTLVVTAQSLKSGNTSSCGCVMKGDDSIGAWLLGTFRSPEKDCSFYVYRMANHPELTKPGIANDLANRLVRGEGEYGELHDLIELPRLDAWLIEQAVLWETGKDHFCPDELRDWDGASELRLLTPEAVFDLALAYHSELQELGRIEFAIRHLPVTPKQCEQLMALEFEKQ